MENFLKLYDPPKQLDEATLKVARKELNEKDEKQVAADIQYIRDWISKQNYLKSRTDDEFILAFLRTAKFSYSRTQELIKNYWMYRTEMPEYFKGRELNDDSLLLEIGDTGIVCVLHDTDDKGRRIVILRIGKWNCEKHEHDDIVKFGMAAADVLLNDPRAQINGVVLLLDITNFNTSHLSNVTPQRAQKLMKCCQDAFPVRIKEIHFFNYPKIFDALFSLIRPLLKEKLKKRMFFHGSNLSSIHKQIPQSLLPKNYEGNLDDISLYCDNWINYMKTKSDLLTNLEIYGADLGKMPKTNENHVLKPQTGELSGTFKKLNVD